MTRFKKTEFYITKRADRKNATDKSAHKYEYEKRSGWSVEVTTPNGERVELCFDQRRRGEWQATERKTGLAVLGTEKTRQKALEKVTAEDVLMSIEHYMYSSSWQLFVDDLEQCAGELEELEELEELAG